MAYRVRGGSPSGIGAAALMALALWMAPAAAGAQQHEMAMKEGAPSFMGVLLDDVQEVREKLLALAEAMPAESYAWRPGEGVRSVGEVFRHVTADNYLIPALLGVAVPDGIAIKADDYSTVQAFESSDTDKDGMAEALGRSFDYLQEAMRANDGADMNRVVPFFGRESSLGAAWVSTTTHLHEHLGQAIAYARTNEVVPPWSR